MTVLVIAEHDNASIKPATLNTVTAAAQCGGDVHVLIAGHNAGEAAKAAAAIAGVAKVIHADAPGFDEAMHQYGTFLAFGYAIFIINEAVFQTEANNTAYTARFSQAMLDHDTKGKLAAIRM